MLLSLGLLPILFSSASPTTSVHLYSEALELADHQAEAPGVRTSARSRAISFIAVYAVKSASIMCVRSMVSAEPSQNKRNRSKSLISR